MAQPLMMLAACMTLVCGQVAEIDNGGKHHVVRPQLANSGQDAPDAAACAASRSSDPTSSVQGRSDGVGAGPPGHAGGVTTRADSS